MSARRAMAAVLLGATAAACSNLRPVPEPMQFINDSKPPVVYVAYGTSSVMMMANPRISGDSLVGTAVGGDQPVGLPWRYVQSIATVRFNKGRTAVLVGGLAGFGALMTYAMISKANEKNHTCDYSDVAYEESGGPECGPKP